jgi:hypothetical protein
VIVTITIDTHALGFVVTDNGGLCGDPEVVATRDQAHAAAEQRMRVYALRGHAVLPWSVPS